MSESLIVKRCIRCQFPIEDCQCNLKMGSSNRPNPYMACAWCGITQAKETTLSHVKNCEKNPYCCQHTVSLMIDVRDGSILENSLFCTTCQTSAMLPSYMQLGFRYPEGKEE